MSTLQTALRPFQNRWVAFTITFFAFLIVAQLSAFLYRGVGSFTSVILSPSGVAFAAVIIGGYVLLPAIALASLVNALLNHTPFILLLGAVIGNTVQAFLACFVLRRVGFDRRLASVKDMFALVTVALVGSTVVPTCNYIAAQIYTFVSGVDHTAPWVSWWLGAAISMLILGSFLIRWVGRPFTARTREQWIEVTGLMIFLVVTSVYLFGTTTTSVGGVSLIIILIGLLFGMAFRAGPRFMTLSLFIMTVISFWGALYGTHPEPVGPLATRIFNTQVFDLLLAFFFFIMVSVEEQRKQAIKNLNEHNTKLEDAVKSVRREARAKNEFIATLAHELRNPLAPLLTSVETLRLRGSSDPEVDQTLDLMHERIKTMGYLLDDLLDISRITERRLSLRKAFVPLERVIRRAVEVTMPSINENQHKLTVTLPEQHIVVNIDALRIEQVIINLLHNAAKYTPPGGKIDLETDYTNGVLTIVVRDTGIGISPDMMERVFEPFVQIHDPRVAHKGIGIGLALTKNLVEMHGGSIAIASGTSGIGTEFTIRMPAECKEAPERDGPDVPPAIIPQKKKSTPQGLTIVVVDDNIEAADSMTKLLTMRGHTAHSVYTGRDTLQSPFVPTADLIILDIGLPDMDGYQLAAQLRAQGITTPLVALTGYGQEDDKRQATEAGFTYHLTKPVGLAAIEPIIIDIVNS